jgi:hypothetical protein
MKIALIVEGETEDAFKEALQRFLKENLPSEKMPVLKMLPQGGRVPKEDKLKRLVRDLCVKYDAVIALTDVYRGTKDFTDAADAKAKMRQWVGKRISSTLMLHNMILRHGFFPFGKQ